MPALVRRLGLPAPDPAEDALAEAAALQATARAGLIRLDELDGALPDEVRERLRQRTLDRADQAWERLGSGRGGETPSEIYRYARLEMLAAERAELGVLRDSGQLDEEVLREVQRQLDVEESLLDSADVELHATEESPLVGSLGEACEHLARPWPDHEVPEPLVCNRCIAEGTHWVHLRMCLGCGEVGCCDSSPVAMRPATSSRKGTR